MKVEDNNSFMDKLIAFEKKCGDAILSPSGARIQFELSIFLVSIIPLFALAFLAIMDVSMMIRLAVFAVVLPVVLIGYAIVSRYPRAILILRSNLEDISKGDLPDAVELTTSDADMHAIKDSLDQILKNTRESIERIKEQQNAIVEMEREKVMYESIGAACHHMGQPAAVLSTDLNLVKNSEDTEMDEEILLECCNAIDKIVKTLKKLNTINEYKTTPYIPGEEGSPEDVNILSL